MQRQNFTCEADACAIIALVDKRGRSTHANIVQTINALKKMGHRSGDINGEGDGCGILTDIPREVWAKRLSQKGLSPYLADSKGFFVGHFLLPAHIRDQKEQIFETIKQLFAEEKLNTNNKEAKIDILLELVGNTNDAALGPRAKAEAPLFWQIAGIIKGSDRQENAKTLFKLQMRIEDHVPDIHIASLSLDTVVYKLRGLPHLLPKVYPELLDEDTRSVMTLGHSRYSTNTLPTVERAQPFTLLGHNGEINTIERLRSTGRVLGIEPVPGGSDSQDLDRVIYGLIHLYGLDPMEAIEMVFPPIHSEVEYYEEELQKLYSFYRWFFPCSAQGPAAVVARYGDICMGSVDALGLRPLWFGESDYDYFLSSEKGVVDLKHTMRDPKPLAPGEKIAIIGGLGKRAEVLDYTEFQKRLLRIFKESRRRASRYIRSFYRYENLKEDVKTQGEKLSKLLNTFEPSISKIEIRQNNNILNAYGWQQFDLDIGKRIAIEGKDVIGSMGHQGPLAAFCPEALPNTPDYFKENVAVVTNPAIDREREAEHFTTRVILGDRPDIKGEKDREPVGLELKNPLLLGGVEDLLDREGLREIAAKYGTVLLEDVLEFFSANGKIPARVKVLDATYPVEGGLKKRCEQLWDEAKSAIENGAVILLIDDSRTFSDNRVYVDPALLVAYLVKKMEQEAKRKEHAGDKDLEGYDRKGLRRQASIIVRSGAIRNLHDIMFLLGAGADALCPYMMWLTQSKFNSSDVDWKKALDNTMSVLQKGMEKVMSTMGIHELCGYGRIFASIGLTKELADIFQIPNFCESKDIGLSFKELEALGKVRYEHANSKEELKIYKEAKRNPKVGRILRSVAVGKKGFLEMAEELEELARKEPIALRHLLDIKTVPDEQRPKMEEIDISVGRHDIPIVIAAMSFGSQGENSFRAYAEAAKKVNIVCLNGEGGEIPDMLGKYRHNRSQQIASGRFGVFMDFLNSVDFLEIKIGQGAKPGEGGHLPGVKVSEMVAKARHCKPGITLISPSNHHDIYSIEDLAQIITELKTANPHAKVSVKIPVTSGVGTIAVGIAKAGADIVNLSGFDGGTGAAREHAKKFVGLPAEVGVSEAHRALVESGLRDKVEIWCDGGMRSGADIVKMILLGANRVGLGTVALMGVGCISCQRCHLDRCPRGISTQLRTKEDAEKKGVKGFTPRQVEVESENLARLLRAIGEEIKHHLAALGHTNLQELVGRTDLLEQMRLKDRIDLNGILRKPSDVDLPEDPMKGKLVRKPLNYLTKLISDMVMDKFEKGQVDVLYEDEGVHSTDRAVGTYLAGAIVRKYPDQNTRKQHVKLLLHNSVPGNGMCAFTISSIDTLVEGGSQDGAAKGSFGGTTAVLKGLNLLGQRVDGSTGKSFAYGAISGLLIVQNMADSRACIRMSGADVVFGGRITKRVNNKGNVAIDAHIKGFAFEYMTGGRAVVLGDPGPWMCAGMTGGVIYQCLYPDLGFDKNAIKRRLARGANVSIEPLTDEGLKDIEELLGKYIKELEISYQHDEAQKVREILANAKKRFVMIVPKALRPKTAE